MAFLTGQSWRVHLFTGEGPKQGLNESLVSSVAQFSPSLFKTTQCWGSCSVRSFLLVVFVCLFRLEQLVLSVRRYVGVSSTVIHIDVDSLAIESTGFLWSLHFWCFCFLSFPLVPGNQCLVLVQNGCFVDTLSTRYVHIVNSPCQTPFGNMTLATSTKQWTAPILIKLKQGAHKDPVPTCVACARKQGLDLVRTWVPSTANAALDK